MTIRFVGGAVWPEVKDVCVGPGRRRAAVAFIGADAPDLMPLRKGDDLVVNASNAALLARATSPDALARFVKAGVRVRSTPRLHAKVVVTPRHVVVGSANASQHSAGLDEAVTISDDKKLLKAAIAFIDGLGETTEVDDDFLAAARVTWDRGRAGGPPGAGDQPKDPVFLPSPPFRLRIENSRSVKFSEAERKAESVARRRLRRSAGSAAKYSIVPYRSDREDRAFRVGDVLIQIRTEGGEPFLMPPVVVLSEPIRVPRRHDYMQMLRLRVDLAPKALSDARHHLTASGTRVDAELARDRWVRSPTLKSGLLGLWGLKAAD